MLQLSVLFTEGVDMAVRGVVQSFSAWYTVGSWLYPYVCVVVWPIWLMNWTVCCLREHSVTKLSS